MKRYKSSNVKKTANRWPLKIGLITLILAAAFTVISEATSTVSGLTVTVILLVLLVVISIIFDGIGVSVTSCDTAQLSTVGKKHKKTALWLVKNAEKVNNICADVIGDICGIVSGACSMAIVLKITQETDASRLDFWLTITVSSVVAAATVGGKAYFKRLAVKNAREMVVFTAKILTALGFKRQA